MGMAMKPTLIHINDEMIADLDQKATTDRVSRSQVIRDAVAAYLETDTAERLAEKVRLAYDAQPLSTPDEWGNMESFLSAVRAERIASSELG